MEILKFINTTQIELRLKLSEIFTPKPSIQLVPGKIEIKKTQ